MNDRINVVDVLVCGIIGLVLGCWIGGYTSTKTFHDEAITYGYARHNPTNGVWEWVKPQTNEKGQP